MVKPPGQSYEPRALRLGSMIANELNLYYARLGTRAERMFYFPGQDPFAFAEPAESIASLYWREPSDERRRDVAAALVEVLGTRMDALPTAALEEVVLAIGHIAEASLLLPMVRRITARAAPAPALRPLFVRALMVLKGFGARDTAAEAASRLADAWHFPLDLLYDAFEIMSLHSSRLWSDAFIELVPRMNHDAMKAAERARARSRLSDTAAFLTKRQGLDDLADGMEKLLSIDCAELRCRSYASRQDPIGALAFALVEAPRAPLRVERGPEQSTRLLRRVHDGATRLLTNHPLLAHGHTVGFEGNERSVDLPEFIEEMAAC
jgi:hypothetical protein